MKRNKKDYFWILIGVVLVLIVIGSLIYDKFFYKYEVRIPTAQEERELKQKLINRYGSIENIPDSENPCSGVGHPLDCW